jgi:hypothetical protein
LEQPGQPLPGMSAFSGLPVVFPMPIGTDWGYEQTIGTLGGAAVKGDGEAGGVAAAGLAAE